MQEKQIKDVSPAPEGKLEYESPTCDSYSPLEHVREWRDNSSQLPT